MYEMWKYKRVKIKMKQPKSIEEGMLRPITKEQIEKVLEINSCLSPEHWNKGMYDSFILGVGLTRADEREKIKENESVYRTLYDRALLFLARKKLIVEFIHDLRFEYRDGELK